MGANSSHPSRQPPVDAPGTAVLYIRGFSYTSKEPCSCTRPELLATTSGGSNARLDLSRIPQELQLAGGITPQEFADNCTRLNDKVKKFIPGGSMTLRTVAVPIIVSLAGVVLLRVGSGMCDDPSPKDYWRCCECVENDENCATRELEPLDNYYASCRAVCNAESATASTIGPGCPRSDIGCPFDDDVGNTTCLSCPTVDSSAEPTRGCHCVPDDDNDVRRESCEIKKDKGRKSPGCREFQYTRVCDDVTHPMTFVGIAVTVLGWIIMVGNCLFARCGHPALNRDIETLCRTLTAESRTGTRWEYVTFTQGHGKNTQYFKCIVVQSGGGQPMGVAQTMQVIAPSNATPGMSMSVMANGQQLTLQVPAGVMPGQPFTIQVPAVPPAPMAVTTNVEAANKTP